MASRELVLLLFSALSEPNRHGVQSDRANPATLGGNGHVASPPASLMADAPPGGRPT